MFERKSTSTIVKLLCTRVTHYCVIEDFNNICVAAKKHFFKIFFASELLENLEKNVPLLKVNEGISYTYECMDIVTTSTRLQGVSADRLLTNFIRLLCIYSMYP